jgi:hypothetical protein
LARTYHGWPPFPGQQRHNSHRQSLQRNACATHAFTFSFPVPATHAVALPLNTCFPVSPQPTKARTRPWILAIGAQASLSSFYYIGYYSPATINRPYRARAIARPWAEWEGAILHAPARAPLPLRPCHCAPARAPSPCAPARAPSPLRPCTCAQPPAPLHVHPCACARARAPVRVLLLLRCCSAWSGGVLARPCSVGLGHGAPSALLSSPWRAAQLTQPLCGRGWSTRSAARASRWCAWG